MAPWRRWRVDGRVLGGEWRGRRQPDGGDPRERRMCAGAEIKMGERLTAVNHDATRLFDYPALNWTCERASTEVDFV